MPIYISKIEGKEKTANGTERNITKQYLCDDKGHILHDKAWEDDPEGVKRRIEVEAMKALIRSGAKLYLNDENGKVVMRNDKPVYEDKVWEEFPGTIDQAKKEMADEVKERDAIEKEYREKLKKVAVKK